MNNIMGSVSVNVPQFSLPTVEDVSRVSMLNVRSAGAEESASHPHGKRKSIRLPDECRESLFWHFIVSVTRNAHLSVNGTD